MKKLIILLGISFVVVVFMSCNKITTKNLIGEWLITSYQIYDYYSPEEGYIENINDLDFVDVTFREDGIWIAKKKGNDNEEIADSGTWYYKDNQLFWLDLLWQTRFEDKKEISLYYDDSMDIKVVCRMKKLH